LTNWTENSTPNDFAEAAEWSEAVTETLDDVWRANNLASLALSDPAFTAQREAAKLGEVSPRLIVQQFGMASLLRDRLTAMGWTPPSN
jgi:hypothetical protein